MLRYVIAALLASAPFAAASGQEGSEGKWALAAMPNGCMVQAVSPQGTMLSVWGFAGEDKLGFLLQNRGWEVEDGANPKRTTYTYVATDLTLATEQIATRRIGDWRKQPLPEIDRRPTVFLLLSAG